MTLDEYYETYKLHRKYSVGIPFPKGSSDYEEEMNKSEFEKKYSSSGYDSYESVVGEYWQKMYNALEKDYNLCIQVFTSFDIDHFFWFTTEFCEWFEVILIKHKKLELLETLKKHVYSFNNSLATERMDEIYNNSINYCK